MRFAPRRSTSGSIKPITDPLEHAICRRDGERAEVPRFCEVLLCFRNLPPGQGSLKLINFIPLPPSLRISNYIIAFSFPKVPRFQGSLKVLYRSLEPWNILITYSSTPNGIYNVVKHIYHLPRGPCCRVVYSF